MDCGESVELSSSGLQEWEESVKHEGKARLRERKTCAFERHCERKVDAVETVFVSVGHGGEKQG